MSAKPRPKPEFPPLLPVGFHPFTLTSLRALCVDRFPLSETRSRIMDGLERLLREVSGSVNVGEIWADGSFLTEKMNPDDVDLVLRVSHRIYDFGAQWQRNTIDWFAAEDRVEDHFCDGHNWLGYPQGHERFQESQSLGAFYTRLFGESERGVEKGIAVIQLPDGLSP